MITDLTDEEKRKINEIIQRGKEAERKLKKSNEKIRNNKQSTLNILREHRRNNDIS